MVKRGFILSRKSGKNIEENHWKEECVYYVENQSFHIVLWYRVIGSVCSQDSTNIMKTGAISHFIFFKQPPINFIAKVYYFVIIIHIEVV